MIHPSINFVVLTGKISNVIYKENNILKYEFKLEYDHKANFITCGCTVHSIFLDPEYLNKENNYVVIRGKFKSLNFIQVSEIVLLGENSEGSIHNISVLGQIKSIEVKHNRAFDFDYYDMNLLVYYEYGTGSNTHIEANLNCYYNFNKNEDILKENMWVAFQGTLNRNFIKIRSLHSFSL